MSDTRRHMAQPPILPTNALKSFVGVGTLSAFSLLAMIFTPSPGKRRRRHRRLLLSSLFARMFVGGCRVLVSLFAMFVSRFGVLLRLFVLAKIMMMGSLMMMMCCRVVMRGRLMMMLSGRMLRGLCHGAVPPNRSLKTAAGCS
jgi:hypothetical protein